MFTGEIPFKNENEISELLEVICAKKIGLVEYHRKQCERLGALGQPGTDSCDCLDAEIVELVEKCCSLDPSKRPNASDLTKSLVRYAEALAGENRRSQELLQQPFD